MSKYDAILMIMRALPQSEIDNIVRRHVVSKMKKDLRNNNGDLENAINKALKPLDPNIAEKITNEVSDSLGKTIRYNTEPEPYNSFSDISEIDEFAEMQSRLSHKKKFSPKA